jgi:flagellar motor protein MotB
MDSISDSRLNTSNDSLGTTTGDSVPTHSNTIHADTPRPSAYDNTSMSDKSVDEEALQDDLLATQMQATASYLSGNISPQQKAAAIAAFHAMLSVAEGESEAKPLDLTESPPKSLMSYGPNSPAPATQEPGREILSEPAGEDTTSVAQQLDLTSDDTHSKVEDILDERSIHANSTEDQSFFGPALEAKTKDEFKEGVTVSGSITIYDGQKNKTMLGLNDFQDENFKKAVIKIWNLIGTGIPKDTAERQLWKQIKNAIKDDSILNHEELCEMIASVVDAIDRVLSMSLILILKKDNSPHAAELQHAIKTMQTITRKQANSLLWAAPTKVQQILTIVEQAMFTEDLGNLNTEVEQHRKNVMQLMEPEATNFVKIHASYLEYRHLCSRLENTDQPSDIVLNPLNELERRNKLQINRNYVYVQQQCQTFVTAAKKARDDEAALYSLAQSFQKKLDEWRRANALPEKVPRDPSKTILNVDTMPEDPSKARKPPKDPKDPKVPRKDRKVSQQTLDFRAECAAAGACTTYNHYRREGKTDDEAKAICRGYYGKTREDQYILVESVKRSIAAKEKSETGDLDPSPSPPVAGKNDTASP